MIERSKIRAEDKETEEGSSNSARLARLVGGTPKVPPTSSRFPRQSPIKWAGGKTQLLGPLLASFPDQCNRYFEPFVGGGAVFFALAREDPPRYQTATLGDLNEELITLYQVIRAFPQPLMNLLRQLEEEYAQAPQATFMQWRERLPTDPVQKAGRFILLNKAGFNGLYRVNKRGKFNVPWGQRPHVNLFDEENLLACSEALGPVHLHHGGFASVLDWAGEGDLVYFDPPYVPVSATANFTGYTAEGFGPNEQLQLSLVFRELHSRGCYVVLSNADTPDIHRLYEGFPIQVVPARRQVNSKGDRRGPVNEVIVSSWDNQEEAGRPNELEDGRIPEDSRASLV